MSKKKRLKNSGFSLVELIIVIAIMAVLVGALAPMLIRYIRESRRTHDVQTADSIQSTLLCILTETKFPTGTGQNVIIANSSTNYNNPATSVADELFIDLNGVPEIKSYPNYYWYIVYNTSTGSVPEIYLTDNPTGSPIFELYPDNTDFIEKDSGRNNNNSN